MNTIHRPPAAARSKSVPHYYAPRGGLPGQEALHTGRAVLT
jgi:hypothetical protein